MHSLRVHVWRVAVVRIVFVAFRWLAAVLGSEPGSRGIEQNMRHQSARGANMEGANAVELELSVWCVRSRVHVSERPGGLA